MAYNTVIMNSPDLKKKRKKHYHCLLNTKSSICMDSNYCTYVLKNRSNPTLKSPSAGILFYCRTDVHILNPTRFTLSFFFIFLKKQQYLNWKRMTEKTLVAITVNCCVNCNQPGGPYRSIFQYFCDLTRMS